MHPLVLSVQITALQLFGQTAEVRAPALVKNAVAGNIVLRKLPL